MIATRVARQWLDMMAAAIDGPKKPRGKGGKSPPTVTLVDIGMTDDGEVEQEWSVYANGQKAAVKSVTDKKGDVKIDGQDLDLEEDVDLTAQQAVAFILHGAHPRYYPKPGKTVTLDEKFVLAASSKFSG